MSYLPVDENSLDYSLFINQRTQIVNKYKNTRRIKIYLNNIHTSAAIYEKC